jgi:hypothetical protein
MEGVAVMHYLKSDGSIWFFETSPNDSNFVLLSNDELKKLLFKIAEEKKNVNPFDI